MPSKMKWSDVVAMYGGGLLPVTYKDPNLLSRATAKGHKHKVGKVWLLPKGWEFPQTKKRRPKKKKKAAHG